MSATATRSRSTQRWKDTSTGCGPGKIHYQSDSEQPGLVRRRCGQSFRYLTPEGRPIRDPETLERIKSLAIPPAWTDVWINTDPLGHLQATGRDDKGRKQYRYHNQWRSWRESTKFDKMREFARALPKIRRTVERDLARPGLPRRKVLATVVRLLELTLIRVGNDEYARSNGSFGLTTMRDRHVRFTRRGSNVVRFCFRGKGGIQHQICLENNRLAGIVERCRDLPGQELFQYVDEQGRVRDIGSGDVNEYLRTISGGDFTAKDFRTWAGSVFALVELRNAPACETKTAARREIVRAVKTVAERLGNTPAVCRKSYIHPTVLDSFVEGSLDENLARGDSSRSRSGGSGLRADELALLALLRDRA